MEILNVRTYMKTPGYRPELISESPSGTFGIKVLVFAFSQSVIVRTTLARWLKSMK